MAKSNPFINKSPLASMGDMVMEFIYLQPVTCEEIGKILLDLKNTACGWDEMSASFLRLPSQFITQPLAFICNQTLTEGVFPEQLKLANVIPLYKVDDLMLSNHYRPLSLMYSIQSLWESNVFETSGFSWKIQNSLQQSVRFQKRSLHSYGSHDING